MGGAVWLDPKGAIVKDWSQGAAEAKTFLDELEQVMANGASKKK